MFELLKYLFESTTEHCTNFLSTMKEIASLQAKVESKLVKKGRFPAFIKAYFEEYPLHVLDKEDMSIVQEIDTRIKSLYSLSFNIPLPIPEEGISISPEQATIKAEQDLKKIIEENKQLLLEAFGPGSISYAQDLLSYKILNEKGEPYYISMNLSVCTQLIEHLNMAITNKFIKEYEVPPQLEDKFLTYINSDINIWQNLNSIYQAIYNTTVIQHIISFANKGILGASPSFLKRVTKKIIEQVEKDMQELSQHAGDFSSSPEELNAALKQFSKQIIEEHLSSLPILPGGLTSTPLDDEFSPEEPAQEPLASKLAHADSLPDEYYAIIDGEMVLVSNKKDAASERSVEPLSTELERMSLGDSLYPEEEI